jgi:hypothetical protein
MAMLEAVEQLGDLADVAGVPRLRDHVAVRPPRDRLGQVVARELGGDGIHADPALAAAEVTRQPLADDRARGRLAVRRYGVLEVQDEPIGGQRQRLLEHLLLTARDEMDRAPRHQAVFFRIIAWRRARITSSPCWFFARCSKVTMPHCGRDFDSRLSTISVSE